jgi:Protein of unknown function (DUF3892)
MSKLQIRCINKTGSGRPHERIRAIGGFYANGSPWRSQEEAIRILEEGSCRFFVSIDSRTLNVVVTADREGCKYLKTETDGEFPTLPVRLRISLPNTKGERYACS